MVGLDVAFIVILTDSLGEIHVVICVMPQNQYLDRIDMFKCTY